MTALLWTRLQGEREQWKLVVIFHWCWCKPICFTFSHTVCCYKAASHLPVCLYDWGTTQRKRLVHAISAVTLTVSCCLGLVTHTHPITAVNERPNSKPHVLCPLWSWGDRKRAPQSWCGFLQHQYIQPNKQVLWTLVCSKRINQNLPFCQVTLSNISSWCFDGEKVKDRLLDLILLETNTKAAGLSPCVDCQALLLHNSAMEEVCPLSTQHHWRKWPLYTLPHAPHTHTLWACRS